MAAIATIAKPAHVRLMQVHSNDGSWGASLSRIGPADWPDKFGSRFHPLAAVVMRFHRRPAAP
jgi:hypothetical protein